MSSPSPQQARPSRAGLEPARRPGALALPRPRARAQFRYLRHLFDEPHRVLEEIRDREGPVVELGGGPVRIAIVGDPAVVSDLFVEPVGSFRWKHRFNPLTIWTGKTSIAFSDGADHRRRRGATQAGFSRRNVDRWIPTVLDATDASIDRLVASVDEPGPIDLYPIGRSLALDVVVEVLGGEPLARHADEIGELMARTQDYLEAPAINHLPHPLPVGRRHEAREVRRALDRIIDGEIDRIRAAADSDASDVLTSLVRTGTLTDTEIRDQMATIIGAGSDTTASTLAWTLLRGVATPGLWDRIASEADAAFGALEDGRDPDRSTLAALGLAERTVREALRLHPPGAFGVRETVADVAAGGFLIPRGTLVAWSTHLAGRDPDFWPDPLVFDPDRHLDPTPEQAANAKAAWVPYGGGAHMCLGAALAQVELTLTVARLAQRLRLTSVDDAVPPATRRSRPHGGAPFHVSAR